MDSLSKSEDDQLSRMNLLVHEYPNTFDEHAY